MVYVTGPDGVRGTIDTAPRGRSKPTSPNGCSCAARRQPSNGWRLNPTRTTAKQRSITMAKTVIGLFDGVSEAQRVRHDSVDHGFQQDAISLITHQERASG